MSETQRGLNENRKRWLGLLEEATKEALSGLSDGVDLAWRAAYADGALSGKVKHLMAVALAAGTGCRNCVLAHTEHAVKKGATKEEFLEVLAVVVSMRGTTGIAESLRVVQFLDELGEWSTEAPSQKTS